MSASILILSFYIMTYSTENSKLFYTLLSIFSVFSFSFFIIIYSKLNDELKVNFSLLLTTSAIMILGIEIYFEVSIPKYPYGNHRLRMKKAEQMKIPFDTRTKYEVIRDLRNDGQRVFSNICPFNLILDEKTKDGFITTKNELILPLGTISNVKTIFPNESGYYPIIITDEHGFNNPKGLYNENDLDILLVGDSYAEGCSVNSDETIGAILREEGYNTISLGKFGNDPLIEFASLREYGYPYKPKIVLWCFYVNDLPSLDEYKSWIKSPILGKYLDEDDFTQNLIMRQKEIDSLLIKYEDIEWKNEEYKNKILKERENEYFVRILKLYNLRSMLGLTTDTRNKNNSQDIDQKPISDKAMILFSNILQKANQLVSGWNGEIYFIYLPSYNNLFKGNDDKYRNQTIQIISDLDIPIIDIKKEVFDKHSDPVSLFPFKIAGHYNAKGYRLIGQTLLKKIKN